LQLLSAFTPFACLRQALFQFSDLTLYILQKLREPGPSPERPPPCLFPLGFIGCRLRSLLGAGTRLFLDLTCLRFPPLGLRRDGRRYKRLVVGTVSLLCPANRGRRHKSRKQTPASYDTKESKCVTAHNSSFLTKTRVENLHFPDDAQCFNR
jgi:hypothetical protein